MPPKPLHDLKTVNFEQALYDLERIREINPQRYEFEQLTAVHHFDPENFLIIGSRDIGEDEFWVRGHVPGNPVFPGVLMLECAAQLCSVFQTLHFDSEVFFGFGGVNNAKFRSTVKPGDKMAIVAKGTSVRARRSVFSCQGFVGERLVFEAEIIGVSMG